MELYKRMYAIICHAVSLALEHLPDNPETAYARGILQEALYKAEELYIEQEDI